MPTGVRCIVKDPVAYHWGRKIQQQRELHDMTRDELADAVGVTRTAVYRWEMGDTHCHPRNHLAVARALKIPPAMLFDYPLEVAA